MKLLVLALILVAPPAQAAEVPGSGFASLELSGIASGTSYDPSKAFGQPVELSSPYASAALHLGAGQGISSVSWPGQLGANLGSTVILLGAPPEAAALNDPVLAHAQSGSRPDDSNTSVPGSTMTAHATTTDVTAEATAAGLANPATSTGATAATAAVKATGTTSAVGEATSNVRDISLGGVVHIGSIVSVAHATTDGVTATATGRTEVTDVTIAGQAVILDGNGLTVAGTTLPAGPVLAQVEAALAKAQITLTVSQPTKIITGGSVQYATGSLIASTPLGVVAFGGATLSLAATVTNTSTSPTGIDSPGPSGDGSPDVPTAGLPGQVSVPGVVTPPVATPTTHDLPPVISTIVGALLPLGLDTGYRPLWAMLGIALALGAATAFSGLPARWLPPLEDTCPLEKHA